MTDDLSTKARQAAGGLRESLSRSRKTQADDLLIAKAADLLDQVPSLVERAETAEAGGAAFRDEVVRLKNEVARMRDIGLEMERQRNAVIVERDGLEALLDEIAGSGVVFENERVDYVEVQIDRDTWLILTEVMHRKMGATDAD